MLEKLREITTLSVEQRLVATLARMSAGRTFAGEDGRIVLGASRYRLLCELVGATRESVSLVLGRLAAEGFVERSGTSYIIAPPDRLAERFDLGQTDAELTLTPHVDSAERAVQ